MKNLFILCTCLLITTGLEAQNSVFLSAEIFADLGTPDRNSIEEQEPLSMHELMGEYPLFPGGEPGMIEYIQEQLEYPEIARTHAHEGTVVVQFVVKADGSIGNVELLKGIGLGCNEAALAVFEKMPIWKPAYQGGRAVAVKYITPVKFRLQ